MFEYLNWAAQLEGISPVARLLAIWMANHCTFISSEVDTSPDQPVCEVDIDAALVWIGCSEGELLASTVELIQHGVSPLLICGRKLRYTFPNVVRYEVSPAVASRKETLSIYVISGPEGICKIGISRFPAVRLANLQAANPVQPLKIVWTATGAAPLIRRTERQAHEQLAAQAIANEWFRIEPGLAVDVVKGILATVAAK